MGTSDHAQKHRCSKATPKDPRRRMGTQLADASAMSPRFFIAMGERSELNMCSTIADHLFILALRRSVRRASSEPPTGSGGPTVRPAFVVRGTGPVRGTGRPQDLSKRTDNGAHICQEYHTFTTLS